jgi:hypothetical protein
LNHQLATQCISEFAALWVFALKVNVAVHNTGTSAGRLLLAAEQIECIK